MIFHGIAYNFENMLNRFFNSLVKKFLNDINKNLEI